MDKVLDVVSYQVLYDVTTTRMLNRCKVSCLIHNNFCDSLYVSRRTRTGDVCAECLYEVYGSYFFKYRYDFYD